MQDGNIGVAPKRSGIGRGRGRPIVPKETSPKVEPAVGEIKKSPGPPVAETNNQEAPPATAGRFNLSANAPVFVPRAQQIIPPGANDLSPTAPEFVPRAYRDLSVGEPALSINDLSPTAPEFVPRAYRDLSLNGVPPTQTAVIQQYKDPKEQLLEAISLLTASPGSFDQIMGPLTISLCSSIQNDETLIDIQEEIFIQAVREANFRYTAARICNYFSHHLTTQGQTGHFRQHLLRRCQKEHNQREELVKNDDTREHLIGFTLFFGELTLNMRLANGETIGVLPKAVVQLLQTLLLYPQENSLKCVVQVLKLTGAHLEEYERKLHDGKSPSLDELFTNIKTILVSGDCSRSMSNMLLSVIELRAGSWGGARESPQQPVALAANFNEMTLQTPNVYGDGFQPVAYDETVYCDVGYDDYGQLEEDPSEEWQNDYYEYICEGQECNQDDPNMDDEIAAAYEDFIKESEKTQQSK